MKNIFLSIFFCIILLSCKNTSNKSEKISLKEFSEKVESKEEKDFFLNNKFIDNTKIFQGFLEDNNSRIISRPRIKFMWSGYNGGGCLVPLGICVILGRTDDAFSKTIVTQHQNKLIILPMGDENGLTSDGFLPIFSDVALDSSTVKDLGIKYKFIKSGIYKANFDDKQKKYIGVAVDLN